MIVAIACWLTLMWSGAVVTDDPKKNDEDAYLKYAIPDGAKRVEHNAKPGSEYVVMEFYFDSDKTVGARYYWDREKTKLHSEELFITPPGDRFPFKHGIQRCWYPNGQLKSVSPYRKGQMHGTFQQWSE